MKKIFLILGLATAFCAYSQKNLEISPKLKEVTVYYQGAELSHTASATLEKGENEVVIKGLSPNIMSSSLKIEATGGVVISASELAPNYVTEVKNSAKVQKLKDSIDLYENRLSQINSDINTNKSLQDLLLKGVTHNVSGEKEAGSTEKVTRNMEYYKTQSRELNSQKTALVGKQTEVSATLSRLKKQLNTETLSTKKQTSDLRISLSSPISQTSTFTVTYYTEDAGWEPVHDIVVASEDKPVSITTRAQVCQRTGLDWNNTKITLSTGKPNLSRMAPEIGTWFLKEKYQASGYGYYNSSAKGKSRSAAMKNSMVALAEAEDYEEDAAAVETGTSQVSTLYFVNGNMVSAQDFSQIGTDQIKKKETLSEKETAERFGYYNSVAMVITTKSMEDYVTQSDNQLNRTFEIDLRYNIPGNGKTQNIQIGKQQADAEYRYLCIPKMETETYLIAELKNWEKLSLLSGSANITYGTSFVGKTYIDAASAGKLSLTLGVDKRIAVKREKMKDFSVVKFLGSDTKVTMTYKITVKNNKNKKVKLAVKDQYPVSTNKKYEVELLDETTKPTVKDENTGVITWEGELAPAANAEYVISYSIKYPKSVQLNIE